MDKIFESLDKAIVELESALTLIQGELDIQEQYELARRNKHIEFNEHVLHEM